jgi:hypothetical protein
VPNRYWGAVADLSTLLTIRLGFVPTAGTDVDLKAAMVVVFITTGDL